MGKNTLAGAAAIQCPHCGQEVSITEALCKDLEEGIKVQYQEKIRQFEVDLKTRNERLAAEKQTLEKQKAALDQELASRLARDRGALEAKLRSELQGKVGTELTDLKTQIAEKERRLGDAMKMELDLRKKNRDLEEKEKGLAVEIERKLDAERKLIEEQLVKRLGEEFRLKAAEKDMQLDGMRKQIEDLKRKSEQGSQQIQGEVFEEELETLLRTQFPGDHFEPVEKGKRGGDLVQTVMTPSGRTAGTILWEAKRAKNFQNAWIDKAKEDQRSITAEHVVIVSTVLPKEVRGFGEVDGVMVVELSCAGVIAGILRHHVIQINVARSASSASTERRELLYQYLCNTQFRQRIEAFVETLDSLRHSLEKEKRSFQAIWSAREQHIGNLSLTVSALYGDLQGIVGGALPRISSLELDAVTVPLLIAEESRIQ